MICLENSSCEEGSCVCGCVSLSMYVYVLCLCKVNL